MSKQFSKKPTKLATASKVAGKQSAAKRQMAAKTNKRGLRAGYAIQRPNIVVSDSAEEAPFATGTVLRPHVEIQKHGGRATAQVHAILCPVRLKNNAAAVANYGACFPKLVDDVVNQNIPRMAMTLSPTGGYALRGLGGGANTNRCGRYLPRSLEMLLEGYQFVRYRVSKLAITYVPSCPADTEGELTMSISGDPIHPNLFAPNEGYPNVASLQGLENTVSFAPWQHATIDISEALTNEWRYCSAASTVVGTGSMPTVAEFQSDFNPRFSQFASIACLTNQEPVATLAEVVDSGNLVIDFDIEFCEHNPVLGVNNVLQLTVGPALIADEESIHIRAQLDAMNKVLQNEGLEGLPAILASLAPLIPGLVDMTKKMFSTSHKEEDIMHKILPLLEQLAHGRHRLTVRTDC
jgi:hypothetical protein